MHYWTCPSLLSVRLRWTVYADELAPKITGCVDGGMDARSLAGKIGIHRTNDDAKVLRPLPVQAYEVLTVQREQRPVVDNGVL